MNPFKWWCYFLYERRSWIVLLILLDILLYGVAYIDKDIAVYSALYIIGIQWLMIVVFLMLTFFRETSFYRKLEEGTPIRAIHHQEYAETPFEKTMVTYLENKLDIQQRTLEEQKQQLHMHEQILTEFVHDIKTPITAMKLLIEQEDDFSRRQQMMYEWSRIDYMLDQQLFLSRLNYKANDLYFETVALRSLIVEEIHQMRHVSMRKGIGFQIDLKDDLYVHTDKRWLKMVLRQILSNAVKYMVSGEVWVKGQKIGEHVQLIIQDEGCGIAQHDLPRIFQRGFTGSQQPIQSTASGMGLYLVDAMKEALGLNLKVKSKVNEGTTVIIYFAKQNEHIARMSK
ncbi:HAMP domain-containing sensor histidine kinase [Staphylococcus sp. 17KM0847]|uniref:sensor histidine kinase n=1 Tax=Staphylococcus sp. 17KM0847 TaxID=2583989 RepID=UPI0015DBE582|nr:HAMP domain-containing sensor histidine kinase [Staphylococcus sp. 17KM0847]QLK85449.1 HAMP domain-containing histidine kinase [Staphylococcus sp. 17KM0847]